MMFAAGCTTKQYGEDMAIDTVAAPVSKRQFRHQLVTLLPRLHAFALGLTGSGHHADDLVQATCERALARWEQWSGKGRLDGWVFRILHNLWRDGLRADRVRALDPSVDMAAIPDDHPGSSAFASVELAEVRRAVEALPDDHRAVLLLVCVEGLSYQEAADVLETPIGTVRSRLSRARAALIDRLAHQRVN